MRLLRFPDLIARGLFNSRMTLKRAIDTQGFPPGVLITPNARAWGEDEVNAWTRPQKGRPPKGCAAHYGAGGDGGRMNATRHAEPASAAAPTGSGNDVCFGDERFPDYAPAQKYQARIVRRFRLRREDTHAFQQGGRV